MRGDSGRHDDRDGAAIPKRGIFDRDDSYLSSDAVFAVEDSLICDFVRHEVAEGAPRFGIAGPYCTAEFAFRLTPATAALAPAGDAQRRLAALGAQG